MIRCAILIAALLVATPAHARWVTRTILIWQPDRPHYLTKAQQRSQLCQSYLQHHSPLPPTWMEAASASRDRELACDLRYGVRTHR